MKGKITISRPTFSDEKEAICISLTDSSSGVEFVELEMTLSDFTKAITGQGFIPIDFDVRGLEFVGLTKETEKARITVKKIELIDKGYDINKRGFLEAYLTEHAKRDGWIVNAYLGSQDSVVRETDHVTMNFSYNRYVKPEVTA